MATPLLLATEDTTAALIPVVIIALILAILVAVSLTRYFLDFTRELHYLEMEIGRTQGERREKFIKKRRNLWLSLIPFVKYK